MKHRFNHASLFHARATCGGKNCYPSKHDAETVKAEQEILKPDLRLKVYHCIQCGSWHLTRQSDGDQTND